MIVQSMSKDEFSERENVFWRKLYCGLGKKKKAAHLLQHLSAALKADGSVVIT